MRPTVVASSTKSSRAAAGGDGVPSGEQQGGGVELSVTEKARTLLKDGCARVSVAHDVVAASR